MHKLALVYFFVLLSYIGQRTISPYRYTVRTEPADSTLVTLLLIDSTGLVLKTNYKVKWVDTTSGDTRYELPYNLDSGGQPTTIKINPGSYDIILGNRGLPFLSRVPIVANRRNIIKARVPRGGLRFRYEGKPKQKVTEYVAKVSLSNMLASEKMVQPCSKEGAYQPGTYDVEINTLPVTRFTVDIDWRSMTEIQLTESGGLQIANRDSLGTVMLYRYVGRKAERFYELNVPGDTTRQKRRLKPGAYEAQWTGKPGTNGGAEHSLRFEVRSNETTRLVLE
jgi:hypothetical protein